MSFCLTILGSSSALPTSNRFPTAHVLNVHEHFFLVDCGEGAQIQLRKFKVRLNRINHIFISHLHGDHYFGLPGLISTFVLLGRTSDLHIFGPPELEHYLTYEIIPGYKIDFTYKLIFHSLNFDHPEKILENKHLTVESFPLKHRIPTCGFVFREKPRPKNIRKEMIEMYKIPVSEIVKIKNGSEFVSEDGQTISNSLLTLPTYHPRSYAYCSDTLYSENIIETIKNVDLLYHETTFAHDAEDRARETHHSTTIQAATIAKKSGARKLLIGHFSARYKNIDKLESEARSLFPNTVGVNDGDTFSVPETREIL